MEPGTESCGLLSMANNEMRLFYSKSKLSSPNK